MNNATMIRIRYGAAAVLMVAGLAAVLMWRSLSDSPQKVVCTLDARVCPDGSTVGRIAPSCEFALCPGENEDAADADGAWSPYVDPERGVAFEYPGQLWTNYIRVQEWPPTVEIASDDFSCREGGSEVQSSGNTAARTIDGRLYCVNVLAEGAAGSVFTAYAYTTEIDRRLIMFRFTLRFVQCGNFDAPMRAECEAEREAFDVDGIVHRMAETFIFIQ